MLKISNERTSAILNSLKGKAIAVIGDVMLDKYYWGSVSRISPEAPVPVIDIESETDHLGGAANVANNLKSIGIEPLLCGVIGDDASGKRFKEISSQMGIDPLGLYIDDSRPSTVKTRIIGNNQQIARMDHETREPISQTGEKYILDTLMNYPTLSGIIFEDYDKGTISPALIDSVMNWANESKIPVFVDPKFANFFHYKDAFLFKPNRKEAEQALKMQIKTKDDVAKAGNKLISDLNATNVLITLGAEGMMLCENSGNMDSVPTNARKVADVSGAGDTAIATLAACIAGGAEIKEAATLANFASGVVCEEPGIISITPEKLFKAVKLSNQAMEE